MKRYVLLFPLLISLYAQAAVRFDFHVDDTIVQKTLQLNSPQVLFTDQRSIMTYNLTATLLEESNDYSVVSFTLTVTSTNGRSMTYDYSHESIKMNSILHLKDLSYLYPLVLKATLVK
jgi:hypothetical protein